MFDEVGEGSLDRLLQGNSENRGHNLVCCIEEGDGSLGGAGRGNSRLVEENSASFNKPLRDRISEVQKPMENASEWARKGREDTIAPKWSFVGAWSFVRGKGSIKHS
ncbi:MAG: hypothetical protein Aurels2KO_57090 [Aureliella sp.]